jgi:MFS family permease
LNHPPRRYDRNIPRFYLFTALTALQLWMPIWIVFFRQRGLTLDQIGTLELVGIGLLALAEIPTGIVADNLGRRTSLVIGAILQGATLLGLLAEVLSPVFLLAYAVWGVSFSFVSGAADALVYDSLRADGRSEDFTHVSSRYAMVGQAAGGIGAILGGLLAVHDPRLCFVITAAACFVATGVALSLREPPFIDTAETERAGFRGTLVAGLRIASGHPRVRAILVVGAIISLFTILLSMTALQPYGEAIGIPVWAFGGLLLGIRLFTLVGSSLAPRLAARFPQERLIVVATMVIAGAYLILWWRSAWPALAFFAVAAASAAAIQPLLSAMLNDAIPSAQRATIISLQSLIAMLGLGLVQWAFFAVGQRTTIAIALGFCGLLMAILSLSPLWALARPRSEPSAAVLHHLRP